MEEAERRSCGPYVCLCTCAVHNEHTYMHIGKHGTSTCRCMSTQVHALHSEHTCQHVCTHTWIQSMHIYASAHMCNARHVCVCAEWKGLGEACWPSVSILSNSAAFMIWREHFIQPTLSTSTAAR